MADTIHTQEIIKFELLMRFQVLLQSLIDNIRWFTIRSIEISNEIFLYYLLVECCKEAIIELIYLLLILPTFYVEVLVFILSFDHWFCDELLSKLTELIFIEKVCPF